MAKTTKKSTPKRSTKTKRKSRVADSGSLLSTSQSGPWGKDQPMVLMMSAGIVMCIVLALFLTGWL